MVGVFKLFGFSTKSKKFLLSIALAASCMNGIGMRFGYSPCRIIVLNGSDVALECAGFLTGIGLDTTVMVRSIALRGFDQVLLLNPGELLVQNPFLNAPYLFLKQMAVLVTDYMEAYGTKFAWKCIPKKVEKLTSGALQVTWMEINTSKEYQDTYDCILWAVGESLCCHIKFNLAFIHDLNVQKQIWDVKNAGFKLSTEVVTALSIECCVSRSGESGLKTK